MNTPTPPHAPPTRVLLIAAFAIIYVIWGSTYLAIRLVVETLPPFLSAGFRFTLAGGLMFLLLTRMHIPKPTRSQWHHSIVTGILLLLGGNGLVMWAEKTVPSGLTALIVALAPVWFVLLDWIRPGGMRPHLRTVIGVIIGFAGVLMLVTGHDNSAHPSANWWSAFAIMAAGISWAGGSLYAKHSANTASPWMNSAAQMLCGGVALLLAGILVGEPFRTDWRQVSSRSLLALGYLIIFGSWVAFSAYVWLLKASTPSRVSTYAYVNPVIAVFLGWLLLGETISPRMMAGALVILAGVITITLPSTAVAAMLTRVRPGVAR